MKKFYKIFLLFLMPLFINGCGIFSVFEGGDEVNEAKRIYSQEVRDNNLPVRLAPGSRVDTVIINDKANTIEVLFNQTTAEIPMRDSTIALLKEYTKEFFEPVFTAKEIKLKAGDYTFEELIPNFFRKGSENYDTRRLAVKQERPAPIVRNISKNIKPVNGLYEKNVGLWHSHGWYYSFGTKRWEWQRPRLFLTVEDLLPMSVTIPYLVPMLENAGANVFIPRERDTQTNEVVVDNDNYPELNFGKYKEEGDGGAHEWNTTVDKGFFYGYPPYTDNYNPFEGGTSRYVTSTARVTATAKYIPNIPEDGEYAVYISYQRGTSNVEDASYTVYHKGGATEFKVNQQIGGQTWIYLGTFEFAKGENENQGVVLTNKSETPGKRVSADAVRFGGGMGLVARDGRTSKRPKFVEAARYWLQYAGIPDSTVYSLHEREDYKDDYKSRAEYLNYLKGAPFGPNEKRDSEGMGIPMDVSVAFHTDAGITRNDTTIGTLSIFSILDADSSVEFPDGVSRLANRDFADIIQTEIVNDIRAKYDRAWNRRQLKDAEYSEAFRPNMPGVLIELLSHQNMLDMQYLLDPRFKFDVARSMYKGVLKFLSVQYGYEYVVQPLPVTHFSSELDEFGNAILRWKAQTDSLEETAMPDGYMVYKRIDDSGFDNGTYYEKPFAVIENIEPGHIYSFKVTGVNKGGESFPSEILSVYRDPSGGRPALIVNGFDRVCAPPAVNEGNFGGFVYFLDNGVPYKRNINLSGAQYNFKMDSPFISNDSPGHGASMANRETEVVAGNSFDYPFVHGKALAANGVSFVSCSDEVIEEEPGKLGKYSFTDVIMGEEKSTYYPKQVDDSLDIIEFRTFTPELTKAIEDYLDNGGNLLISGSYIATDPFISENADTNVAKVIAEKLKYVWGADHASAGGGIRGDLESFYSYDSTFAFVTELNDSVNAAESADALRPLPGADVLLRYIENNEAAAIGYKNEYGVAAFGFPFEAIKSERVKNELMKKILTYLEVRR